jgi:chemotaxis protein MotA
MIVLGGTFAVVMMRFTLSQFLGAFKTAGEEFSHKGESAEELIAAVVELATVARNEALLAQEGREINNPVFANGYHHVGR